MTALQRFNKRVFDIFLSLVGIVLTFPLMALTAVLIRLDSKGSAIFVQERVGEKGKSFRIYKFRTMVEGAEKIGPGYEIVKGDSRITRLGHFLRRWCIDELPQLFNVLKGDMSCVGPRPTLRFQVEQYDDFQMKRLNVKPGMTGLATVKGRNSLSWPERIKLDVWYVEHYSFWLDISLILQTFRLLKDSEGVYAESSETFRIREQEKKD